MDRSLLMLDYTSTAISFFAENMDCVDCNNSALDMFCFVDKDEYINGFYRCMPPFQANGMPSTQFFKRLLTNAFKSQKIRHQLTCQRTDGILLPVEVILKKVEHEGKPVVIASFYDLSGVKSEMDKTVSASEIAHLYLSAAPLAMELFNDQYRIIDCNKQALELLGFSSKEQYMKRTLSEAGYHDMYTQKQDEENFHKALTEGIARYEWVFKRKDGEKIPCEITRVRITGPDRIFVVSYIHDLSTVKAMAAELKKAEAIERESRAKNQFLAQMSHVLRTPLNVITGLTGIQLQKTHPPETEETFLQIQRSSEMLLRIITDILDLSNADSGELKIQDEDIDIPSLIIDIAQQIIVERELESVKLLLHVDEKLPSTLIGDSVRIKQVANSILSNAFKYTEKGIVTLSFRAEQPSMLVISVSDTGQGMTPAQVESLFNTERSRYNEQGTIQGVGLGLILVQRLIKAMNGTIDVTSEKGVGSNFTVKIPLVQVGETLLGASTVKKLQNIETARDSITLKKVIDYEPMPYGKVLVVDDVESNLYVAWGLMKPYGLTVDTALGGFDALKKIKGGAHYDIIFMDHMMPDMDGIQTAKAIMDTGCTFPIVALTANVIMGQAALFEENGFSGFLSKPIDMKQLNSYLLRFIRDKYPEEAEAARAAAPTNTVATAEFGVSDELAKHFIRDAKNAVTALEDLIKKSGFTQNELKNYTIVTHGMKSALANVNVPDLSNVAATLEDAGRSGNLEKIFTQTPAFITKLKEVYISFEQSLSSETDNETEDDLELLKTQLTILIEACEIYSKPSAKKAMTTLKEGQCSKKTQNLIDEINAQLLHGEFEQAAEMAQNYLAEMVAPL
ncbi:MAG: ATP-binding protein [Defluviitaleaceae bacterium]|nr:ATP-binding protein [Defluviitaleaceae bacterium]